MTGSRWIVLFADKNEEFKVTRIVGYILLLLAGVSVFMGMSTPSFPGESTESLRYFIGGGASAVTGFLFLALARIIDLLKTLANSGIPQKKQPEIPKGEHTLDINLD